MIEQFFLKETPERCESNKLIFTATNGQGYMSEDKLHICGNYHFVYQFEGRVGWYMKNPQTSQDYYLGGGSPSVLIQDINIIDKDYFDSLLVVEENKENIEK